MHSILVITNYILLFIVIFSANLQTFFPLTYSKQNSNLIGIGVSMFAHALPLDCECNYGVIINETSCSCQCFDGYLLPNCLFTSEEPNVSMSLWIRTNQIKSNDKTNSITSSMSKNYINNKYSENVLCWLDYHNVIDTLASAFAISNRLFQFVYAREWLQLSNGTLIDGTQWPSIYTNSNVNFTEKCSSCQKHINNKDDNENNNNLEQIIMLVIEMPGWIAQHLYNDAIHDNLSLYVIHSSNNITNSNLESLINTKNININSTSKSNNAKCVFVLFAVDMHKSKPLPSLHYNEQWIRLTSFGDRGWYLTLPQFGWFIGFVLLVVFILIIEVKWAFNVDYNVGGGGVIGQTSWHKAQHAKRSKKLNDEFKQMQNNENSNKWKYHHTKLGNVFHNTHQSKNNKTNNKKEYSVHNSQTTELIEVCNGNTITTSNVRARRNDHNKNNNIAINSNDTEERNDDYGVALHRSKK